MNNDVVIWLQTEYYNGRTSQILPASLTIVRTTENKSLWIDVLDSRYKNLNGTKYGFENNYSVLEFFEVRDVERREISKYDIRTGWIMYYHHTMKCEISTIV
jgi:hypothetical protein